MALRSTMLCNPPLVCDGPATSPFILLRSVKTVSLIKTTEYFMIEALAHTLVRIILSVLAGAVAIIWAMWSGFAGGGGRTEISFASLLILSLLGWSALPAIRASRVLTVFMIVAWGYLGVYCAFFGAEHVKGWLLQPWLFATFCNAVLLAIKPPRYWHTKKDASSQQSDTQQ
ncbi:hypothetical protein ACO0LF_18635 [Undibacterium sp. Di27W]|uniref:hypothetical protein n=1 Tax=Undibacterium sp. Di27W TaxID=3413036 RepID=UPI003BF44981